MAKTDDPYGQFSWSWFYDTITSTSRSPSFPLVWMMQKVFQVQPVSWLSLAPRQLSFEVEERKLRARHLQKAHQYAVRLMFLLILLELLRQPLAWITDIGDRLSCFRYVTCTTLFHLLYGFVAVALLLMIVDILRISKIPPLQISLALLREYHAEYLANSSMFMITRTQEEDPRDKFARHLRSRQIAKQEAEQASADLEHPFNDNSQQHLFRFQPQTTTFQRSSSGSFGTFGSHKSQVDTPNRSINRSFGSTHSSGSKSSSPSCLFAGTDWDPLDREEIENYCGRSVLEKMLSQEEQHEKQRVSMMEEETMNWSPQIQSLREQNYQSSAMFYIPSPKKTEKQKVPPDSSKEDQALRLRGEEKSYPQEDYSWQQLKVHVEVLHLWTENVRMWLADTVISPLLLRIDQVNEKLHEKMRMENVVGDTAPDALRSIAQKYRQEIPELLQIIPFLDISMQQDYVVNRLRDLAKDGVLGDYSWNSGSSYGGQPWQDFLPSDAALIMHSFITFLDVVLPPDPHASNWRSFSHRFVLRNMNSWKTEEPSKPMIHLAVSNPPKYQVLSNGLLLQVAEGKNNVFHTILLFTRLLQLREKNGISYANLGPGRIIFKIFEGYA